jgi:hypothetical protein
MTDQFARLERKKKVSSHRLDRSNDRIAAETLDSVVIAIFARHSTLLPSNTILLKVSDRVVSRFHRQEFGMERREFMKLPLGAGVVAALSSQNATHFTAIP